MREAFVIYRNFFECIEELSNKDQLKTYRALANFALNDIEAEDLTGTAKIIYDMAKPSIIASAKRYDASTKGGRPTNNSDNSPIRIFDYAEDVILTENQYSKLIDKEGERIMRLAIEEVQIWLENGKTGNPNYKKARLALGHNHYSYFNRNGWAIEKAKERLAEEQKQSQPNWSI